MTLLYLHSSTPVRSLLARDCELQIAIATDASLSPSLWDRPFQDHLFPGGNCLVQFDTICRMESKNEVLVGSIPPADHIDKREDESFDPDSEDGLHLKHDLPNHDGGHEMADLLPREHSAHTHLPHSEHKILEIELRAAQERIEKLHGDLQDAEKKLAGSQKNHSAASKQAEDYEKEVKNQEEIAKKALDECSMLKSALEVAETSTRELEQTVKNLESEIQTTKAQVLENNEAQTLLEEAKVEKVKSEEENCLMREKLTQLEGHLADEKSRAADLEGKIQNAEIELKRREDSLLAAEGTTAMVKEQLSTLEEKLERAQDELKAKKDASSALQAELTSLKSEVPELLTKSEEKLKLLEGEHQEQMKASEERYEALQKSLLELEGKTAQLHNSLDVAGTDAETARRKVAELELELENLLQNKCKFEEGATELQLQLKSTEETLSKQVYSLKVAEENAEKANGEVVHLQSVLKSTEEKLRVSEEVVDSLQLHVTDLTSREAKSVERLKEVEDGFQKMQLELQLENSKLVLQLEEKAAELQESLAAAVLEGEGARKKVSDLEIELDCLRHIQGELEEKVRISEEKCSQHENSAHTLRTRGVELEGLITEHKTKADDAYGEVASLEAALLDTQNKAASLEMKLKVAEDNSLLLENMSGARIAELERCTKEYEAKVAELETAYTGTKSVEQDTLEILHSTEKMLEERQTEMKSASQKISELELSVGAMESDLKGSLKREKLVTEERALLEEKIVRMEALILKLEGERGDFESRVHQHMSLVEKGKVDLHEASIQEAKLKDDISSLHAAKAELQDLLSQIENEKQMTIAQLGSTQKSFVELNEQLVQERQQIQQQIATIMQENGDLAQKFASSQEKLHAALAVAELSAKQVQEGSLKESTLNAQIEDLNSQLRRALDACTHVERLDQENKNLTQKFASTQEKLDTTLGAAEVSARQLQEALLKESTLNAQMEDLKSQLGKAMDACSQVEKLELILKNCITTEEHQTRMDQVLAASRLAESNLADVEQQLSKSKLEVSRVQKAFEEQETHVKELESMTTKSVEVFDQQPSGFTKSREIELDSQSPGKVRNRKKKGVTWEADGDAALKTRAVQKPAQSPAHSLNQFVANILIAAVSLLIGLWLAKKIHL